MDNNQGPKPVKWHKRGPLRLEVLIPLALFYGLASFYMSVFFDSHLKRLGEWSLTQLNGAEVNIGNIQTSFLRGTLAIEDLQVTNREQPEENIFQMGRYLFNLNMDALLRAKFVVEEASLVDIGLFTPRRRPGRVLPVDEQGEDFTSRLRREILSQVADQYEGTPIADLGRVLEGGELGEQIGEIAGLLKAEEEIDKIISELNAKEQHWSDRIESFERETPIDRINDEVRDFKFNSSRPQDSLAEIRRLRDQIRSEVKDIQNMRKEFRADLAALKQAPGQVDELVRQDIQALRSRLSIPAVDSEGFAMGLFGRFFGDLVTQYTTYSEAARQYMPPPREPEDEPTDTAPPLRPPERSEGENFAFPVQGGYPLFWLVSASINSSPDNRAWAGGFEGHMRHLSSRPEIVGEVGEIELKGDLLDRGVEGLHFLMSFHHHQAPISQNLEVSAERFLARDFSLASSERLTMSMNPEYGSFNFKASNTLDSERGSILDIEYQHQFHRPNFEIAANSELLSSLLNRSVAQLDPVEVSARARGPLRRLSWSIDTNVARAIERGIRGEVSEKIAEQERKLREKVEQRVGPLKDELNQKIARFEQQYERVISRLNSRSKEVETLADNKVDEAVKAPAKEAEDKVRERAEDAVDSLRRRLGR